MNAETRIVIVGGGYTGMLAALRLARRTRRGEIRIVLINPSDRFTERLRLHQVAAGRELARYRIPDLLTGTGIEFVRARVVSLEARARQIRLDTGRTLRYDRLIYAVGATADTARIPGAAEHAWTLDDPRVVHRFAARLAECRTVAVLGAGPTGIEAATEIAANNPNTRVTLIGITEPGAMMGERARAYLRRALDRLGVTVVVDPVTEVRPDGIQLASGTTIPADLTLWTAGVRNAPLAASAGIATDPRGAILVDATLKSVSHPEIRAIGDAAAVTMPWGPLHGTCQSGMPTAAYAADTTARELRGKPVRPFHFGYIHQPVSLGRRDAVIQFTHPDDTPLRAHLTGRLAVVYKAAVSASPVPVFRLAKFLATPVTLPRGGCAQTVLERATIEQ
ncbi:FAD-dependent oxidoreductase [Nocardia panacis]|uniref:FAD-dependent oxidoreductase n=1 Tax=Nocardia panacis TaxID=2340916 RepID=A0A3A4K4V8_9NOCA|nr:FAD-dependent oxidoreductase [Nocardia panacis]RJO69314.1 FAD-dependent oxidoreductase [Nocardia panacis]